MVLKGWLIGLNALKQILAVWVFTDRNLQLSYWGGVGE